MQVLQQPLEGVVIGLGELGDDLSQLQDPDLLRGPHCRHKLVVKMKSAHWVRKLTEVEFDQTGDAVNVLQHSSILCQVRDLIIVKTFLESLDV